MKCPYCGAAELVLDTRMADGVSVVTTEFCTTCGEGLLNRMEAHGYAAALRLAKKGGAAPDMEDIPRRRENP